MSRSVVMVTGQSYPPRHMIASPVTGGGPAGVPWQNCSYINSSHCIIQWSGAWYCTGHGIGTWDKFSVTWFSPAHG